MRETRVLLAERSRQVHEAAAHVRHELHHVEPAQEAVAVASRLRASVHELEDAFDDLVPRLRVGNVARHVPAATAQDQVVARVVGDDRDGARGEVRADDQLLVLRQADALGEPQPLVDPSERRNSFCALMLWIAPVL